MNKEQQPVRQEDLTHPHDPEQVRKNLQSRIKETKEVVARLEKIRRENVGRVS